MGWNLVSTTRYYLATPRSLPHHPISPFLMLPNFSYVSDLHGAAYVPAVWDGVMIGGCCIVGQSDGTAIRRRVSFGYHPS